MLLCIQALKDWWDSRIQDTLYEHYQKPIRLTYADIRTINSMPKFKIEIANERNYCECHTTSHPTLKNAKHSIFKNLLASIRFTQSGSEF